MQLKNALKLVGRKRFKPSEDFFKFRSDAEKTWRLSAMAITSSNKEKMTQQLKINHIDYEILLAWERLCQEKITYITCRECGKWHKKTAFHEHCPECKNGVMKLTKSSMKDQEYLIEEYECSNPNCEYMDFNYVD